MGISGDAINRVPQEIAPTIVLNKHRYKNMLNKLILIFCTILISAIGFSQQRISLEFSSQIYNLSVGFNYQKVVRNHFLFGGGVFFGGKMYGFTPINLTDDQRLNRSPFVDLNQVRIEDTASFELIDYSMDSRSFFVTLNTGFFHNFGIVHGIRFNTNLKIGYAKANLLLGYRNLMNGEHVLRRTVKRFSITAFSPEIYHTIRQSSKFTFYYGFKFPIYFHLNQLTYDPQFKSDAYILCKPELVGGISYAFGRCD